MSGDVGGRASEGRDDETHVLDEMIDGVALNLLRRIAETVASEVGRDHEKTRGRKGLELPRPRLSTFREAVKEDEHLAAGGTVDHRAEAKAVGLDHVLARRHLSICLSISGIRRRRQEPGLAP